MKYWMCLVAILTVSFACLAGAAKSADCQVDRIYDALTATLEGMKPREREDTESEGTEGGIWYIYSNDSSEVKTIRRVEIGENYNIETRLSIVNDDTWGIARTFTYYLRQCSSPEVFKIDHYLVSRDRHML
jgi:hypothetical protein